MNFVLDASVAVRWYLREEASPEADAVLDLLLRDPYQFAVPELFSYEVFSVLCRTHPEPNTVFREGFLPLLSSGILRYPMTDAVASRAFPFIGKGLTGYDSCYAALAAELGAVWLTYDAKAHDKIGDSGISYCLNAGLPRGFG